MKKLNSMYDIVSRYDGILFDAYGVLLNESGCLPGAIDLLEFLKSENIPYWMLSNGSPHTLAGTTQKYVDLGLDFPERQVITSGSLLKSVLPKIAEPEALVAVLGTEGSYRLVSDAGFSPVWHYNWVNLEFYKFLEHVEHSQYCHRYLLRSLLVYP